MQIQNVIALLLAAGFLITPAIAGEKYVYGLPDLRATVVGTNEFSPGDEGLLTLRIENQGLNKMKLVQPDIIPRDELPNEAKFVTVSLKPGDNPISVKSGVQVVGDIAGSSSETVSFIIKIREDASPGTYSIPVEIDYTFISDSEQLGDDALIYSFDTTTKTVNIDLEITSEVMLGISNIDTESLNVGTEGYLTLDVENTGYTYAKKAIIHIARNGNSPLVPTDSSVFVGDFAPGDVASLSFKVAVSSNAETQLYPLDVYVEYENGEGEIKSSDRETIGVPVGGKIDFIATSDTMTIYPGEKKILEVVYKNVGAAKVYNAQARLSAVDPFSSNDDTAYLGDLAPGESATARFEVSVDTAGTVKKYGLDSEIRYRDALDNSQISDTIKVQVEIVPRGGMETTLTNPLVLSVIAFVILAGGYYVFRMRKSQ